MMVVTLIPVLIVAFTKSEAEGDENTGTTEEETPDYTSWFVALGTAFFSAMLLACMFLPCNARQS